MEILKDYLSQPPQGGYLNRLEGLEGPKEGIYGLSFSQDSHPEDGFTGSQLEDQVLCYTPLVLGGVLFLSLLSAYWREVRQRNKVGKQDSRLVAKEIDIYRGEEFGVKLNIGNPEYYPPYSAGEERVRRVDREETQADRRSGMTPKQLGLLRTAVKARISSDEERSHAANNLVILGILAIVVKPCVQDHQCLI